MNNTASDILSIPKMETIVGQLMQIDEYIITDTTKNKNDFYRTQMYQHVFELNKTSKEAFKKSYQYYVDKPEIAKLIFDSIAVRSNRIKNDTTNIKKAPVIKKDSSAIETVHPPRAKLEYNLLKSKILIRKKNKRKFLRSKNTPGPLKPVI